MPYIKEEERHNYQWDLNALIGDLSEAGWVPGHVTYVIYKIVLCWFKAKASYDTICQIRGTLAGVLSEFDRRHAFNYEDQKINDNGDV